MISSCGDLDVPEWLRRSFTCQNWLSVSFKIPLSKFKFLQKNPLINIFGDNLCKLTWNKIFTVI